jgi:hypothetical protein
VDALAALHHALSRRVTTSLATAESLYR